jgi:protein FAM32A
VTHSVTVSLQRTFIIVQLDSTAKRPRGITSSSWGVSEACRRPNWPTRACHDPIMSDYSHRPGGSLKLKGGVADGGIKKKYDSYLFYIHANTDQLLRKKKSSKSQDKEKNVEHERKDPVKEPERIRSDSPVGSSGRNSPAASSSRPDRKTQAEKRFEEVQRKRVSPFLKFYTGYLRC